MVGAFITVQNAIIILMLLGYNRASLGTAVVIVLGFVGFSWALLHDQYISDQALLSLQWGTLFLGILSKLPQVCH